MSFFEQILSRIDLLGIPIILNFSKAKKVRSSFGGYWTLVFLGFVIWSLYTNGNELWEKKKPTLNQGVKFNKNIQSTQLSSLTFPMMVYINIDSYNPATFDYYDPNEIIEDINYDDYNYDDYYYDDYNDDDGYYDDDGSYYDDDGSYYYDDGSSYYDDGYYEDYTYNYTYDSAAQTAEETASTNAFYQAYGTAAYVASTCSYSFLIHTTPSSNGINGTWLPMEQCTKAHFARFGGTLDSEAQKNMKNGTAYCLPQKSYGLAYGFSISVECNTTSATNYTTFMSLNPIVEVYYPKYGLSLQDYKQPIQPYLFYYDMPMVSYTSSYSYWTLNYLDITTDQGWLTTSNKKDRYVQISPTINPAISRTSADTQSIFIFKMSQEEYFYTRTYTKIQNVLAAVGGLAGSILAALLIVITPFARLKLSEVFVNEMFELRTQQGPKDPDEKQKSNKSKKSSKGQKSTKVSNDSSVDGKTTKKDNVQTLEMTKRNSKDPSKETQSGPGSVLKPHTPETPSDSSPFVQTGKPDATPVHQIVKNNFMEAQSPESHGDESPLIETGRIVDPQPPQSETVIMPQSVKKVDETSAYVQPTIQTRRLNNDKGGFGLRNSINVDKNKICSITAHKDLENPDISPELPPIVSTNVEEGGEEKQIAEKDDGRNANQATVEDKKSRRPRKDGILGTLQNAFTEPEKLKKPKFINITFLEYLTSFVYKSEPTKQKIRIINAGLDMLDNRMDVFNIMKKLRDVDKMKGLFLDKDQAYLFDRLSRPDIGDPSSHWYQEDYLSYYETLQGANELEELQVKAQVMESKRALQDKPQKSEVDERILKLM